MASFMRIAAARYVFSVMRSAPARQTRINPQIRDCTTRYFSSTRSPGTRRDPYFSRGPSPITPGQRSNAFPTQLVPNIVVGSVIGVCVIIYGYHKWLEVEYTGRWSTLGDPRPQLTMDKHTIWSPENFAEGRYYTILTSTLTHHNLLHLGVNMFTLSSFGPLVVALFGSKTFAILWVGAGLVGGLAEFLRMESPGLGRGQHQTQWNAVGASSSIFAVVTALCCSLPRGEVQLVFLPVRAWAAVAISIGGSVACELNGWLPEIGHAAHLGGIAFGGLWWLLALRKGRMRIYRGL